MEYDFESSKAGGTPQERPPELSPGAKDAVGILERLGIAHKTLPYPRFAVQGSLGGRICEASDGLVTKEDPLPPRSQRHDDIDPDDDRRYQEVENATFMVQLADDGRPFVTVSQEINPEKLLTAIKKWVDQAEWTVVANELRKAREEAVAQEKQESAGRIGAIIEEARAIIAEGTLRLLPDELRDALGKVGGADSQRLSEELSQPGEVERWTQNAKQRIAEYATLRPEVVSLLERESRGEIITNFGGTNRSLQCWVIRPDGSFRDPDITRPVGDPKKGVRESIWKIVTGDEIALARSQREDDVYPDPRTARGAVTAAQLSAISTLEQQLHLRSGMFGLNPEVNAEANKILAAIKEGWGQLPQPFHLFDEGALRVIDIIQRKDLGSIENDNIVDYVNHALPFTEHCENRNAQVVAQARVSDGFELVVLAYHKSGHWQANLRLREVLQTSAISTAPEDDTGDAIERLRRKFTKP